MFLIAASERLGYEPTPTAKKYSTDNISAVFPLSVSLKQLKLLKSSIKLVRTHNSMGQSLSSLHCNSSVKRD